MKQKNKSQLLVINLGRQFGGVEKVCENLVREIDDEIFQSYVLCIRGSLFHQHILKFTDNIFLLPSRKLHVFFYFPLTMFYILKHRINIIHCHGVFSSLIGSICGFLLRRKVVTTIHGLVTIERGKTLKGKIFTLIEDILLHFNQKYICVSYFLKNRVDDRIGESDKIDVIYNSVIPNEGNGLIARRSNDFSISAVGRLETIKGHIYLIKAVERLVKEGFNVQCFIAGEGSQKDYYEAYIHENNLTGHIKLIGFIDDVGSFISSTSVFVNPSLMETFGLSVVEAMSIGMPIIATDVGALGELIKDDYSGILIVPEDDEELYLKLKALILDKNKRKLLIEKSKEEFDVKFSTNSMITSYSQLYKSL